VENKQILDVFWNTQRPTDHYKKYPRLRDPFRKVNLNIVNKMMGVIDDNKPYRKLKYIQDDNGVCAVMILHNIGLMFSQTKTIKTFNNDKYLLTKNDVYIQEIAGSISHLEELIKSNMSLSGRTIIETDMQLKSHRDLLSKLGFDKQQNKISSFADIYGIFVYPSFGLPRLSDVEEIGCSQLICEKQSPDILLKQISNLASDLFENHYSNYNKNDTWKGLTIRGFGGDEKFIIKPSEMPRKWKKANQDKLDLQIVDTPLRKVLSGVEEYLQLLIDKTFDDFERIRILKLGKNDGVLERHTDNQDKELGLDDEQIVRLHFPLKSNDKTQFSIWNTDGTKTNINMKVGNLYYLDIRKPHQAVNKGDEDRLHLVVDVRSNKKFRDWLKMSYSAYPSSKVSDDYYENI